MSFLLARTIWKDLHRKRLVIMVAGSVQKIEQSGNQGGFAWKTVMEKDYGTWLKLAYDSVQNQISRFVILTVIPCIETAYGPADSFQAKFLDRIGYCRIHDAERGTEEADIPTGQSVQDRLAISNIIDHEPFGIERKGIGMAKSMNSD